MVVLTIVRRPDTKEDIRSFPALAVTIVLCAPETAVRDKRRKCVTIVNDTNIKIIETLLKLWNGTTQYLNIITRTRSVVSGDHEAHFNKFTSILR